MSPHVSTLTLHHYRYGELEPERRAAVDGHLAGCDRCRRRLQVQQADREQFVLEAVPPALSALGARAPATPWWRSARGLLLPAALAAAVTLAVVVPRLSEVGPGVREPEITRVKGEHEPLEVWIGTDAGPRKARPEDVLRSGDRVQLVFDPEGAPYVALAGRDGSGEVEVWTVLDTRASPTGLRHAPFGLTLDDTPGAQEFLLVPLEAPLTEAEIARRVAAGPSPNGRGPVSVVLGKE